MAGGTSKNPTAKPSGSTLLPDIVWELNIKTGYDVHKGLVKLMDGLLKDKLQN